MFIEYKYASSLGGPAAEGGRLIERKWHADEHSNFEESKANSVFSSRMVAMVVSAHSIIEYDKWCIIGGLHSARN